jgi:hypothetical protein
VPLRQTVFGWVVSRSEPCDGGCVDSEAGKWRKERIPSGIRSQTWRATNRARGGGVETSGRLPRRAPLAAYLRTGHRPYAADVVGEVSEAVLGLLGSWRCARRSEASMCPFWCRGKSGIRGWSACVVIEVDHGKYLSARISGNKAGQLYKAIRRDRLLSVGIADRASSPGVSSANVTHRVVEQATRQHYVSQAKVSQVFRTAVSRDHAWPPAVRLEAWQLSTMDGSNVRRLTQQLGQHPADSHRARPWCCAMVNLCSSPATLTEQHTLCQGASFKQRRVPVVSCVTKSESWPERVSSLVPPCRGPSLIGESPKRNLWLSLYCRGQKHSMSNTYRRREKRLPSFCPSNRMCRRS